MEIKNRYWDKRREDMFSLNSTLTLVCFRPNILDQRLITGYGGWLGCWVLEIYCMISFYGVYIFIAYIINVNISKDGI